MSGATSLKHRIQIMEPTYSDGEYGGPVLNPPEEWTLKAAARAQYRDLSGREFFAARQMNAELSGEFKIRYRTDIKPSYKVVWGKRIFDIAGPPRDIEGKKIWLWINVEEQF